MALCTLVSLVTGACLLGSIAAQTGSGDQDSDDEASGDEASGDEASGDQASGEELCCCYVGSG